MYRPSTITNGIVRLLIAVTTVVATFSCGESQEHVAKTEQADQLMNTAYKNHDYDELLLLADKLQAAGELSDMKANYWRGYAYSRQRKMRLAESNWKKAIALDIKNDEDMEYYSKSANRLASMLLMKSEYEGTMKVAMPAMKRMEEAGMDLSCDYAYLLNAAGCCQLKLENKEEAAISFEKAYQKYQEVLAVDANKTNFTSAIVGVITITDHCLMGKYFQEAYDWTDRFATLLNQYKQLPTLDSAFIDKQYARLNLYRASALEGLGKHDEAAKAYDEALNTYYSKSNDGRLEATNYLMSAERWDEAAHNYQILNEEIDKFNVQINIDVIQRHLLPKYRANINAHYTDSAIAVGTFICNALDSAILRMKQDEASELTTLYNTQQKETEIMQQKANLSRQRFLATMIVLVLVIMCSALIIYLRHQSSLRIEEAYNQLEIANEHIKESSRMKTSFIQQISHEIRTPLNILSGFTQIITTPGMELDEDTRKDVNQKILENTNRITELVNKMLELSDINSKTIIERNDHVLAVQIAAEAIGNVSGSDKSQIPIDLQLADGCDALMLQTNEQAATRSLTLMLDNAKKYTKEGSICLRVDQQDGTVRFIVEDTGIGVPPEEAEHIFEEFVQLDEYAEGTGIGLSVARSIGRRLGGDVVLDTSYTGGARFILTLPTGKEEA